MKYRVLLGLILSSLATVAMAKDNWQPISFNSQKVFLYMDVNSLKPRVDKYQNRYLEARFSYVYQEPQKLKSGKYYRDFYQTLAVDCENEAYASYDWQWTINATEVSSGNGKKEEWNRYNGETNATAVQARALCKYYKSFLG